MTVNELLDIIIPLITAVLIGVFIFFGVQLILIASRVKKILERLDILSDVTGWVSMFRKWPKRSSRGSQ